MICDIIQGHDRFIYDDSQISMLQAEKVYGSAGKTEVFIQEL